ncbi:hypothetical protein KJ784_03705 [Patescibacteria group bacterium]|nr:hypothetical protein [Patescibacteria group bacterium]
MPRFFKKYQIICAVAVLIGTIVGAGAFGLPFVMAQSGWSLGFFYLIILTGAVILVHLAYGEIILRTSQAHCLVGYAGKYLGQRAKIFTTLVAFVEYYGSLLAYIILGGEFLRIIFSRWLGGSPDAWVFIFFILAAAAVGSGLKFISGSELVMTLALIGIMALLAIKSWPLVDYHNFMPVNWANWFLPYGVILFALSGSVAVPEMRQILKGQEKKLKTTIFLGTLISAVVYLIFAWAVVGVSGQQTSEDAILGLVPHLGNRVVLLGATFGVLAVFTSFIALGLNLKNTYRRDYHLSGGLSFILTCTIPLLAYWLGIKSFILVIGFVGAVAAGLDGIITILIYLKAKRQGDRRPEYSLSNAKFLSGFLIFIFSLGLIAALIFNK